MAFGTQGIGHSRLGTWATLILIIAMIACFAGCDSASSSALVAPTATPRATWAAFAEYRLAYLSRGNTLHAVTLDGKTDSIGPTLPLLGSSGASISKEGISPDGHYLAYSVNVGTRTQFALIDLHSSVSIDQMKRTTDDPYLTVSYGQAYWAPDSQHIAALGDGGIAVIDRQSLNFTLIPNSANMNVLGWSDATHIIARVATVQQVNYDAVDITSGQRSVLFAFPAGDKAIGTETVSPDGKRLLFFNDSHEPGDSAPTRVALIDLTTGAYTPLPNLVQQQLTFFNTIAWQPGDQTIAVGLGDPMYGPTHTYLIDLATDSATHLADNQLAQGWSPDGATLILSNEEDSIVGRGPYSITAMTFSATGQPSTTVLTTDANDFQYLGFALSA